MSQIGCNSGLAFVKDGQEKCCKSHCLQLQQSVSTAGHEETGGPERGQS